MPRDQTRGGRCGPRIFRFMRDARIVTRDGCVIATAVDSDMAREIAEWLNENDWKREEENWAL